MAKGARSGQKWIAGAVEKKGSFKRWCQGRGYAGVNHTCIREALKVGGLPAKRARLALTLKKMQTKKKHL